jgi:hypothetical protein
MPNEHRNLLLKLRVAAELLDASFDYARTAAMNMKSDDGNRALEIVDQAVKDVVRVAREALPWNFVEPATTHTVAFDRAALDAMPVEEETETAATVA